MPASLAFWTAATESVGARIVENDRGNAGRDGTVKQFGLLVGVVVVHHDHRVIAELFRLGGGAIGFSLEERIVVARRDDSDCFRIRGKRRAQPNQTGSKYAQQQSTIQVSFGFSSQCHHFWRRCRLH